MQGNPASVPAHDLNDERAMVRLGRRAYPVDRLGRDHHRRVKPERVVGGGQIIVNGLGHPDDTQPIICELLGHTQCVLATDRDQRLDAGSLDVRPDPLQSTVDLVRVGPRGPQDGATTCEDPVDVRETQRTDQALQRALPTVPEAHELIAVSLHSPDHRRPDNRVQSRAISAACQHSDSHESQSSGDLPTLRR